MVTTISRPSELISEIRMEQVSSLTLFKFSDELQSRMETLLEIKKKDLLDDDDTTELEAVGELDRILTHANSMIAAQDNHQSHMTT